MDATRSCTRNLNKVELVFHRQFESVGPEKEVVAKEKLIKWDFVIMYYGLQREVNAQRSDCKIEVLLYEFLPPFWERNVCEVCAEWEIHNNANYIHRTHS